MCCDKNLGSFIFTINYQLKFFVLLQYQCFLYGLYCAESALEDVACIEFVMTFPDKIFICIKHFIPSTHGLKIKDSD